VKKILILSANPKSTSQLRLDEEVRNIHTRLEHSKNRDQFEVITRLAVRVDDLHHALLYKEPQIVHFCGHGSGSDGLMLVNNSGELQFVSTKSLAKLFKLFKDKVECVLLNACYSEVQAKAIHQNIDYVIGMNQAISDRAAIKFTVGFYDAIGAGKSYEDAFELGCISIDLEGIPESETPVLLKPVFIGYNYNVEPPKKDFNDLHELLTKRNWKEANVETHRIILEISNKKYRWQLDKQTIKRFPCDDLRTIDELWVYFSEKEFSFSTQKRIYSQCFERFGVLNYNLFGERVGWKSEKGWHTYDNYPVPTHRGHFPKPPHLFNIQNTLKVCLLPLAISLIVCFFLFFFNQPVVGVLTVIIGFNIALLSFIIYTSSYLEGLEWMISLTSKLEECEQ